MLESVTCIYACMRKGMIHYREVDEFEGETLHKPTTRRTKLPMTLGLLTEYILKTCPLITVLDLNCFDTVDEGLAFFTAEAAFYPEIARLCEERVRAYYAELDDDPVH